MDNIYELIYMVRQDDEYSYLEIFNKYKLLINKLVYSTVSEFPSCKFFIEDIQQESYVLLMDIVLAYRDDSNANFKTFLYVCILRKIKSLIKHYMSEKYKTNINSISLDSVVKDDLYVMEVYKSNDLMAEPSYKFFYNEASIKFKEYYNYMKDDDKLILKLMSNKVNYEKASSIIGCSKKKYDNDIQRIKRKIKEVVYSD